MPDQTPADHHRTPAERLTAIRHAVPEVREHVAALDKVIAKFDSTRDYAIRDDLTRIRQPLADALDKARTTGADFLALVATTELMPNVFVDETELGALILAAAGLPTITQAEDVTRA